MSLPTIAHVKDIMKGYDPMRGQIPTLFWELAQSYANGDLVEPMSEDSLYKLYLDCISPTTGEFFATKFRKAVSGKVAKRGLDVNKLAKIIYQMINNGVDDKDSRFDNGLCRDLAQSIVDAADKGELDKPVEVKDE
jgi:hypothetical protein